MSDNFRKPIKGVRQTTQVKFSNRGYPVAEQGNADWTGTTPRFDAAGRPPIDETPHGVLVYNTTTSGLQLSNRDTETWDNVSAVGGVSSSGIDTTGGTLYDTTYFDGSKFIPASNLRNDGTDVFVDNTLNVAGSLTLAISATAPANSAAVGVSGTLLWNGSFLYYHTGAHWIRSSFSTF